MIEKSTTLLIKCIILYLYFTFIIFIILILYLKFISFFCLLRYKIWIGCWCRCQKITFVSNFQDYWKKDKIQSLVTNKMKLKSMKFKVLMKALIFLLHHRWHVICTGERQNNRSTFDFRLFNKHLHVY